LSLLAVEKIMLSPFSQASCGFGNSRIGPVPAKSDLYRHVKISIRAYPLTSGPSRRLGGPSPARIVFILFACFFLLRCYGPSGTDSSGNKGDEGWVGVWGGPLSEADTWQAEPVEEMSVRAIVNPTLGGEIVRIRFSNTFIDTPVTLGAARIGLSEMTEAENGDLADFNPRVRPGTTAPLTFKGLPTVTIRAHGETVSDPVRFSFSFGDNLAISFHVSEAEARPNMTRGCLAVFSTPPGSGERTDDESGLSFTEVVSSLHGNIVGCGFLNAVDVFDPNAVGTVVAIGDSLTEGMGSPENGPFDRWPWFLARRIDADGIRMGILNMGVSGNTVTGFTKVTGGIASFQLTGPERFHRDVVDQTMVRTVIICLGGNDLRFAETDPEGVISGLQDMVDQGHAAGIRVLLATIPPSTSDVNNPDGDDKRRIVNEWIRNQEGIEGWILFDEALRDPTDPDRIQTRYDPDGDNVHPDDTGRQALAAAVSLDML
jgi:lysophospholipase L1-like esterase